MFESVNGSGDLGLAEVADSMQLHADSRARTIEERDKLVT